MAAMPVTPDLDIGSSHRNGRSLFPGRTIFASTSPIAPTLAAGRNVLVPAHLYMFVQQNTVLTYGKIQKVQPILPGCNRTTVLYQFDGLLPATRHGIIPV